MKIEWNKVTWYSKLVAVILFLIVLFLGFYIGTIYKELKIQGSYSYTTPDSVYLNGEIVYTNQDYGFTLHLPNSWKGYSITTSLITSDNSNIIYGHMITLHNPEWTPTNPTMDIPIQIFSIEQWNKWKANNFQDYPTAAPIGPTERAHNSKYVFATAPRYNYSFAKGFEEVENIIKDIKTF